MGLLKIKDGNVDHLAIDKDYYVLSFKHIKKKIYRAHILAYIVIQGVNKSLNTVLVKYIDKNINDNVLHLCLKDLLMRTKLLLKTTSKAFKSRNRSTASEIIDSVILCLIEDECKNLNSLINNDISIDVVNEINNISKNLYLHLGFILNIDNGLDKKDIDECVDDYYELLIGYFNCSC